AAELEQQAACVRALGFPEHFVRALDAGAAADAAGMRVSRGGLWLPLCDAADPAARCQALLQPPTPPARDAVAERDAVARRDAASEGAIVFRRGSDVARIERRDGLWHALDGDGRMLA